MPVLRDTERKEGMAGKKERKQSAMYADRREEERNKIGTGNLGNHCLPPTNSLQDLRQLGRDK